MEENGEGASYDNWQEDRVDVYITGRECETIKNKQGKKIKHDAGHVLLHELIGHAILMLRKKKDTGNAIDNENKARKELPGGELRGQDKDEKGKTLPHPDNDGRGATKDNDA
ncbi:MAG: hypothetical protein HWD58_00915 [Bacteroidota bacterium]|nr:MAG: hypothetical protein HWD58_00915 [Bacteroidota bacterium]